MERGERVDDAILAIFHVGMCDAGYTFYYAYARQAIERILLYDNYLQAGLVYL